MTLRLTPDRPSSHLPRRNQRGSTIVETALVLVVFITLILFVMDMGRVLVFQQFFLERARTGARNAIVNNWTSTMTANFVCYNSTTAPTGNSGAAPGILGLLPSQVTVSTGTQSGTSVIQVSIQGISLFTWVPGMSGTYKTAPITVTLPAQSLGATS